MTDTELIEAVQLMVDADHALGEAQLAYVKARERYNVCADAVTRELDRRRAATPSVPPTTGRGDDGR